MAEITVYGASDDLIEIDGDIREEFYAGDDEANLLAFSDGTLLEVTYTAQGIWRINALSRSTSTRFEKHEATGEEDATGREDYSDRVTLNGSIAWVVFGKQKANVKQPVDA